MHDRSRTSGARRMIASAGARLEAKATVKLSRYAPSGSTHSKGMATRSVVMCNVVERIRPDGTAASRIQDAILRLSGAASVLGIAASADADLGRSSAHQTTSSARAQYPPVHSHRCALTGMNG